MTEWDIAVPAAIRAADDLNVAQFSSPRLIP
jgi:hypothetical protein